MSLYEFTKDNLLINVIKAYPKHEFFVYDSKIYYQNQNAISGAFVNNLYGIPTGFINIFNYNVDRAATSTGRIIGNPLSTFAQPQDTGLIYPYLYKKNNNVTFKTISEKDYKNLLYGALMTGTYQVSSSIQRSIHYNFERAGITTQNNSVLNNAVTGPRGTSPTPPETMINSITGSKIEIMKNIFNYYRIMSPIFNFDSSSISYLGVTNKTTENINLIQIPSLFYGSEIKKGSVELNYYLTGTLVATAKDVKQNGELIQTYALHTTASDIVVGGVMYKHGFIFLINSSSLNNTMVFSGSSTNPSWLYFGLGTNDGTPTGFDLSGSYKITFKGTSKIPTMTMLADAPKGELNWSNNPTFTTYDTKKRYLTGSYYFAEQDRTIKNVVSSSIADYSGSFKKTTYINHVNIYDEEEKLIAIAKTSKPIKKTEDTDFTFKLKLDM